MYDNYGDNHGDRGAYDEQPDPLGRGPGNGPARGSEGEAEDRFEASLSMTWARQKFFRRLSYLWNGNKVEGHYLIEDGGFPSWHDLFGDLDNRALKKIRQGPRLDGDGYVQTSYIDRKKVQYDLTSRGRTLINKADIPTRELKGDQFESLKHRVGVTSPLVG